MTIKHDWDRRIADVQNRAVLDRLKRQGDRSAIPRKIDFSILFPSEFLAQEFIKRIRYDVDVTDLKELEDGQWDVTATFTMTPSLQAVGDREEALFEAAKPLSGRLDGWGCFAVPSE